MNNRPKYRRVFRYKHYFDDFFNEQTVKVKKKIIWTLNLIEEIEHIPETYLKHISDSDGLYEIRIKLSSNIFRVFCFFDEGELIILMNGFQKKTSKTPKQEIKKAQEIKKEYESKK